MHLSSWTSRSRQWAERTLSNLGCLLGRRKARGADWIRPKTHQRPDRGAAAGGAGLFLALLLWWGTGPASAADRPSFDKAVKAYEAERYAEALPLLRELAMRDHAGAQTLLGVMHFRGLGVAEDATDAALWFYRAARRGHPNAQLAFGAMVWRGLGVERNPERALFWLMLAEEFGEAAVKTEARRLMSEVLEALSDAQAEAVRQRMRLWQPDPRSDP